MDAGAAQTIVINKGHHDPKGTLFRKIQAQQEHSRHVVHALAVAHIRLVDREGQQDISQRALSLS